MSIRAVLDSDLDLKEGLKELEITEEEEEGDDTETDDLKEVLVRLDKLRSEEVDTYRQIVSLVKGKTTNKGGVHVEMALIEALSDYQLAQLTKLLDGYVTAEEAAGALTISLVDLYDSDQQDNFAEAAKTAAEIIPVSKLDMTDKDTVVLSALKILNLKLEKIKDTVKTGRLIFNRLPAAARNMFKDENEVSIVLAFIITETETAELAKFRAEVVKKYLQSQGLRPDQVGEDEIDELATVIWEDAIQGKCEGMFGNLLDNVKAVLREMSGVKTGREKN